MEPQDEHQPSRLLGYAKEVAGIVTENLGWAVGNKQVEQEGHQTRLEGEAEVAAARAIAEGRTPAAAAASTASSVDEGGALADDSERVLGSRLGTEEHETRSGERVTTHTNLNDVPSSTEEQVRGARQVAEGSFMETLGTVFGDPNVKRMGERKVARGDRVRALGDDLDE